MEPIRAVRRLGEPAITGGQSHLYRAMFQRTGLQRAFFFAAGYKLTFEFLALKSLRTFEAHTAHSQAF